MKYLSSIIQRISHNNSVNTKITRMMKLITSKLNKLEAQSTWNVSEETPVKIWVRFYLIKMSTSTDR